MRAGAARTRPPTATASSASPRSAGLVGGASRASLSSASCNNQPASSATHVNTATLVRVSSGAHGRKLTQLLARRRLLGLTRALGKWSLAACSLAAKSKLRQAAKAAANELRTLRSSILTAAQPSLRDLSERSEARRRTHLLVGVLLHHVAGVAGVSRAGAGVWDVELSGRPDDAAAGVGWLLDHTRLPLRVVCSVRTAFRLDGLHRTGFAY